MTRSAQHLVAGLLLFPLAVAAGCSSHHRGGGGGVASNGNGVVLSGVALLDGPGSVLDAMTGKVPGLKVQHYRGECPRVALRNDATFRTIVNPIVYLDGTRTSDTCILESLRSADLERVEVYPTGVSGRPGYPAHPHGLILLFMRTDLRAEG